MRLSAYLSICVSALVRRCACMCVHVHACACGFARMRARPPIEDMDELLSTNLLNNLKFSQLYCCTRLSCSELERPLASCKGNCYYQLSH